MDNIEKMTERFFFNYHCKHNLLRLQSKAIFSGFIKHRKKNFREHSIKDTYSAGSL